MDLLSVGAGACTSVFITGLFKLSNYFARYQPRYRRNSVEVLELTAVLKINLTKQPPPVTLSQTPTQSLKTLLMMIGAVIPLMTMIGTLKTLTKQRTLVLKRCQRLY